MHDPIDQPSDRAGSDRPPAGAKLDSAACDAALPVIQPDQSPAIEPETITEHTAQEDPATCQDQAQKRALVIPTMWR